VRSFQQQRGAIRGACIAVLSLSFLGHAAMAEDNSPELIQPPVCSAATTYLPALAGICTITPLGNGHNEVKVNLTAQTASIDVGGYKVITENYNGHYVSPVVEAMPGDTVAAHLVNLLASRPQSGMAHGGMAHGDAGANPTNLHYFHGGIVSPNNARPKPAELGDGDNVYVNLESSLGNAGPPNSFDFKVPIPGEPKPGEPKPGEKSLDDRVLEGSGYIAHPVGLNWYHSHLHGISSEQVMGGLSGLLSVGDAKANIKACKINPSDPTKCLADDKATADLKDRTEVRYAMLRDISLQAIKALPQDAAGANAEWAPHVQEVPVPQQPECVVYKNDGPGLKPDPDPKLRKGFCQLDVNSAWLFTLNGQRFPTITVDGNRNLLLRLGNVSSNVAYWLELQNEADGMPQRLTILSLDGVVPAKPVGPDDAKIPVKATKVDDFLLMPASRTEIYVRNDNKPHTKPQVLILRTKGLQTGTDQWPEVQLARIVLKPNAAVSTIDVALNAPIEEISPLFKVLAKLGEEVKPPQGCIRDIDPAQHEHRRVTFNAEGSTPQGVETWSITTEIVQPQPNGQDPGDEGTFAPANPAETTINHPFEYYVQTGGLVDWTKDHVCIRMDHVGSHKQLWVLYNLTGELHNFHIHQMKFRLATKKDLEEHHIKPPSPSHTCSDRSSCDGPDFKYYDEQGSNDADREAETTWHDTMPVPPGEDKKIFIIMSFDAKEQIGRFVFHCHILKHEDHGLMAPIEVWDPTERLLQ
jgi:FtsP/CotA-like multicopper oxidase with cupredoxin domain